mgnify:CR=1 FL=1
MNYSLSFGSVVMEVVYFADYYLVDYNDYKSVVDLMSNLDDFQLIFECIQFDHISIQKVV